MTKAQKSYLRIAQMLGGINREAIFPGSSYRCVERMVSYGWLESRFIMGEGERYFLTEKGADALNST